MTPLKAKMLNDLRVRNLAENTQKSCLQSVTGLARYYRRSPDQLSVQEVQDCLLFLSQERHLAWKSCHTIRHGLRFFYQVTLDRPATEFYLPCAKEPSKLPEILSHEGIVRLFMVITNRKHRALLMTTYAAGLRASEVTRLRVTDIDSGRICIRVEQGKGRKDGYVPAPRTRHRPRGRRWRWPISCAPVATPIAPPIGSRVNRTGCCGRSHTAARPPWAAIAPSAITAGR